MKLFEMFNEPKKATKSTPDEVNDSNPANWEPGDEYYRDSNNSQFVKDAMAAQAKRSAKKESIGEADELPAGVTAQEIADAWMAEFPNSSVQVGKAFGGGNTFKFRLAKDRSEVSSQIMDNDPLNYSALLDENGNWKEWRSSMFIKPEEGSYNVYGSAKFRKKAAKNVTLPQIKKRFKQVKEFIVANKDNLIRLHFDINQKLGGVSEAANVRPSDDNDMQPAVDYIEELLNTGVGWPEAVTRSARRFGIANKEALIDAFEGDDLEPVAEAPAQNNPVAKHQRTFNKATVQRDRKKDEKRGKIKHKGQVAEEHPRTERMTRSMTPPVHVKPSDKLDLSKKKKSAGKSFKDILADKFLTAGRYEDEDQDFYDGQRVELKPAYADNPGEVYTLSQWDGRRGWIGDADGSGWGVTGDQIMPVETDDDDDEWMESIVKNSGIKREVKQNWFETLAAALESEGLESTWDSMTFGGINYGENKSWNAYDDKGQCKHISIYRETNGKYERPVHYASKMCSDK